MNTAEVLAKSQSKRHSEHSVWGLSSISDSVSAAKGFSFLYTHLIAIIRSFKSFLDI